MAMAQAAAVALVILLAGQGAPPVQQDAAAALAPARVALVTTYADGRAHYHLVSTKPGSFWTPYFPRDDSWKRPEGSLRVAALKVAWQLLGLDVRVVVSVLQGPQHEREDLVATVLVSPGAHVVVDQLRAYGVQPVSLALVEAAPMVPFLPSVLSITPELEIGAVDLLRAPYPGYRVTVRNLSSKTVANFHVQGYRGAGKAHSFVPRGPAGQPAMHPGQSYTFTLPLSSGTDAPIGTRPWSPAPLDVIEIDSVLWGDGTLVGDSWSTRVQRTIPGNAGRRLQLSRAVDVLRAVARNDATPEELLARIRSGFEALPAFDATRLADAEAGMREIRATVLDDLHRFESGRSGTHEGIDLRQWIRHTVERYERWMARLSP
jgi:hypothetical protein